MTDPIFLWRLSGKTYKIFETAAEQPYRVKNRTIKKVHEEFLRNRQRIVDKHRVLGKKNHTEDKE
jgi:hypothetical protein